MAVALNEERAKKFFKTTIIVLLIILFLTLIIKSKSDESKESNKSSKNNTTEAQKSSIQQRVVNRVQTNSQDSNSAKKVVVKPQPAPITRDRERALKILFTDEVCLKKEEEEVYFSKDVYLSLGDRDPKCGGEVTKLQKFLYIMGLPVEVDGVFGVSTKRALKRFQRRYDIPADGILGPATVRVINRVVKRIKDGE